MRSLFAFILLTVFSVGTYACVCINSLSPEERIQSSKIIVLGKVVSIIPKGDVLIVGEYIEYEVTVNVSETWRGEPVSQIIATMRAIYNDPLSGIEAVSSCSDPIPVSFRGYVVILSNDLKPELSTCANNAWLLDSSEIDKVHTLVRSFL